MPAILTFFFAAIIVVQKLSVCAGVGKVILIIFHNWEKNIRKIQRKHKKTKQICVASLFFQDPSESEGYRTGKHLVAHLQLKLQHRSHQTDRSLLCCRTWQWSGFIFRMERGWERQRGAEREVRRTKAELYSLRSTTVPSAGCREQMFSQPRQYEGWVSHST